MSLILFYFTLFLLCYTQCKAIAPTFDSLASEYSSTCVFVKVDVDVAKDVAQAYRVTSMPTFVFLHKAREVERFSGGDPSGLTSTVARLSRELGRGSAFTGAGAGVAGGATAGAGDAPVNPWARKDFKPPGMAQLQANSTGNPAPTAAAPAAAAAAAPKSGGSAEFDVVCDGDVCRRVPRNNNNAAVSNNNQDDQSQGWGSWCTVM